MDYKPTDVEIQASLPHYVSYAQRSDTLYNGCSAKSFIDIREAQRFHFFCLSHLLLGVVSGPAWCLLEIYISIFNMLLKSIKIRNRNMVHAKLS